MLILSSEVRVYEDYESEAYDQKKGVALRREVRRLYFEEGVSKTQIARRLPVSKGFVIHWTQSRNQDPTTDGRGWPKGKRRIYDNMTVERIRELHGELAGSEREFFTGATAIAQRWRRKYPGEEIPSLRMIGVIMAEEGLSKKRTSGPSKGAASYLCYPEHTVYETISSRLLEADFIGHKYLRGRSAPVNFLGFSFKKAPRLRHFRRIEGQTTDALLRESAAFFERFETPDAIKVDNATAMAGTRRGKRSLSKFMHWSLNRGILPVFSVPRRPFSQASIEGNNSVFSRKFWNHREFADLDDVDRRLAWFNDASQRYCGWEPPEEKRPKKKSFLPRVYFIRQVREHPNESQVGSIEVLNDHVQLATDLIGYFVLAEWQPMAGRLLIRFEKEQEAEVIKSLPFEPNPNSSYKLS